MKKALLLFCVLASASYAFTQTYHPDFLDGRITFKLKEERPTVHYSKRTSNNSFSKEERLSDFPSISEALRLANVTKFERPSYYTNKAELVKIYRVSFSNYELIDELIKSLKSLELVEFAEKEPIYKTGYTPNDYYHSGSSKWYHDLVDSESAWDISTGSSSVKVAIVDNAVFAGHNDLVAYMEYDVGDNDTDATPPDDYNTDSGWSHGTHCGGLATASINNTIGIASLGGDVELMAVKATPNSGNSGSIYYGYDGVQWAVANGANVVSMSYGGTSYTIAMQNLIDAYPDVVYLAAAGNDNSSTLQYPAAYNNVICVGSCDGDDTRSGFSNYNGGTAFVDIAAPGGYTSGGLYSSVYTASGNGYAKMGGTSMATPFAAGLVGLMLSVNPTLTPTEIENCLTSTGVNINANIGPRIDAYAAMQCVQSTLTGDPLVAFSGTPTAIFEGQTVSFIDQSADGGNAITAWQWTFPGGTPSSYTGQTPPAITYATAGNYDVTLQVTNAQSTATVTKTTYVAVTLEPYGEWIVQNAAFPTVSTGVNHIDIVDDNIVWIVGYDGSGGGANMQEFSKTTDGGITWTPGTIDLGDAGLGISMINAIDANTAWVVAYPNAAGETGGIWKTTDGGTNWNRQNSATYTNASSFSNVVHFWDANDGFCQGDPISNEYELYTTTNGGSTWTAVAGNKIPNPTAGEYGYVRDIEVVGNSVWYGTNTGRIYHSSDKGANWSVYQSPATDMQLASYSFSTETDGLLIDDAGLVYASSDAGSTWTQLTTTGSVFTGGLCFIEGTNIAFSVSSAAGVSGSSYSDDGGASWNIIDTEQHLGVEFISPSIGWSGSFTLSPTDRGMWKWNNLASNLNPNFSAASLEVCQGASVAYTDLTTGATPTSWLWNFPGGTPATSTVQNPTVTYSTTGTYDATLTVDDGFGATTSSQTAYISVVSPAAQPSTIIGNTTPCEGDAVTYSVTAVAGLFYDWTLPVGWFGSSSGNSITTTVNNASGTISVEATNGCGASTPRTLAVNISAPTVVANATSTAICTGDQITLTGSGAVSYTWNNSVTDGSAFIPSGNTTYIVTGTDGNGCTSTGTVSIVVNNLPNVGAGNNQTVCDGASVTLSGTGASTYAWDNNVTNGSAFNVSGAGSTNYTVTGTDANGCIGMDVVAVQVNALPTVGAGNDQAVCEGDLITLSGTGANSYAWNNGVSNGVPFTATGSSTTSYTVTGTAGNGCVNTDIIDVTVNSLPSITTETASNASGCGIADGTITIAASGGSGSYTYSIDGGATYQANGGNFSALAVNSYQVMINDGNCPIQGSLLTVSGAGAPNPPTASSNASYCAGDAISNLSATGGSGTINWYSDAGLNTNIGTGGTLTPSGTNGSTTYYVTETVSGCQGPSAQVVITINNIPSVDAGIDQTVCGATVVTLSGSGASTFVWNNGITNAVAFTPSVGTTSYEVTGTDANGCTNTDLVNVTSNANPTLDAGSDQTVCIGSTVTLSGAGASTYSWDNGVQDGVGFATTVAGTTTYEVSGTDTNGCSGVDQVDVIVVGQLPVSAGSDLTVCEGSVITLSGTGAANYVWDNGVSDGVAFNAIGSGTTTYTVVGTDATGCSNADEVIITINGNPIVSAGADQTVCNGESVVVNATGALSYIWDNGVTNGTLFTPTVGGIYTVVGTDVNGCENADDMTLSLDANVDVTLSVSNNLLTATAVGSSYQWLDCDDNNSAIVGATNQTYLAPTMGYYAVIISEGSCTDTSSCLEVAISGVEELNEETIRIFPNPTSEILIIDGIKATDMKSNQLKIIDALGKTTIIIDATASRQIVNVSDLSPGIYFLLLNNNELSFRFIKN